MRQKIKEEAINVYNVINNLLPVTRLGKPHDILQSQRKYEKIQNTRGR